EVYRDTLCVVLEWREKQAQALHLKQEQEQQQQQEKWHGDSNQEGNQEGEQDAAAAASGNGASVPSIAFSAKRPPAAVAAEKAAKLMAAAAERQAREAAQIASAAAASAIAAAAAASAVGDDSPPDAAAAAAAAVAAAADAAAADAAGEGVSVVVVGVEDGLSEEDAALHQSLLNLIKAYSVCDPDTWYCSGMGWMALTLLSLMAEEDAFLSLLFLMHRCGLRGLFAPNMHQLNTRLSQLSQFLAESTPRLHSFFEDLQLKPSMYAADWLLSLFARHMPQYLVYRVFDIVLDGNAPEASSITLNPKPLPNTR
ncbi:unnamed protein product, partial [Closterium sp. NIES-53]